MSIPETSVAYCFDSGYAPFAAVSTLSLVQTQRRKNVIYWCVPKSCFQQAQNLRDLIRQQNEANIHIVTVDEAPFRSWKAPDHFTIAAYLRLLLPEVLPLDRVIYIDADTIVVSDLDELFSVELKNSVIAGVVDLVGGKFARIKRSTGDPYINSGVLVLDMNTLRRERFFDKSKEIYNEHHQDIVWVDQCIINKYADGRKLVLDAKWNRQIFANRVDHNEWQYSVSDKNSSVIHFVGDVKPWHGWCNPAVAEFWNKKVNTLDFPRQFQEKITNVNQALTFAHVLHQNGMYKRASEVKSEVITHLGKANS